MNENSDSDFFVNPSRMNESVKAFSNCLQSFDLSGEFFRRISKSSCPRQWAELDRSQKINNKIFSKIIDSQALKWFKHDRARAVYESL